MDTMMIFGIILAVLFCVAMSIVDFMHKTKEERIDMLINWLKNAVYEAEEYFGSGTGQLKLARVYSEAVTMFPWLAKICDYEKFDTVYVRQALDWLESQMKNDNVKSLLGM